MELPSYALYDGADEHDPDGVIFIRRVSTSLEGLALGQTQNVSWFRAGALSFNPMELYVRMYSTGECGERIPSHYVRLDIIKEMMDYHAFCLDNGLQYKPTLDHYNDVVQAIEDFYDVVNAEVG